MKKQCFTADDLHRYEPRYDKVTDRGGFGIPLSTKMIYVCDVCRKCGDIINRSALHQGKTKNAKLEVNMTELANNHRYSLILRAVQLGLTKLGVKEVTLSMPREEEGQFVFDMDRDDENKDAQIHNDSRFFLELKQNPDATWIVLFLEKCKKARLDSSPEMNLEEFLNEQEKIDMLTYEAWEHYCKK